MNNNVNKFYEMMEENNLTAEDVSNLFFKL